MQRSSESIAALAAALAKAQCELVNPEKALLGTIKAGTKSGEGTERLFRYASLASGLDIVRKTLGQHEIATVQTTAIDQTSGTVNLTTVLAHASGQWIASDWPVCTIADSAEPHRMGAALTYARRYALFTLVGIAGEDDLDAPDLITPVPRGVGDSRARPRTSDHGNGVNATRALAARSGKAVFAPARQDLEPQQSVLRRDLLLSDLEMLDSADAAAAWAQQTLPVKNTLAATDARLVEEAFRTKLTGLAATDPVALAVSSARPHSAGPHGAAADVASLQARAAQTSSIDEGDATPQSPGSTGGIDKAALFFPEPRRIRDKEHLRFVARQPCLVCGRSPSDPHHLRFVQAKALGRKASDEFTVPLCRGHHRELHRCGDEAGWWTKSGIDPLPAARALWRKTHPLPDGANLAQPQASGPGNDTKPPRRRAGISRASKRSRRTSETKPIAAPAAQQP